MVVKGDLLSISSPYLGFSADSNETISVTICKSVLENGIVSTKNTDNSKNVRMTTCIDANITDLYAYFSNTSAVEIGSLIVLRYNSSNTVGEVLKHPKKNITSEENWNLFQYEFGVRKFLAFYF
jgi:hypothetical protein